MSGPGRPVALVLAAGFSRRFGRDKRRVQLRGGRTLLDEVLHRIESAGIDICLVVRADDEDFHVGAIPVLKIEPETAGRGLGASLAAATRQLQDGQGCLICLGDMPFIEPETYAAVAGAMRPDAIAVPEFKSKPGHPVGFGADFIADLRELDGDRGARAVIEKHRDRVIVLPVNDAGIHRDVDTVMDLLRR